MSFVLFQCLFLKKVDSLPKSVTCDKKIFCLKSFVGEPEKIFSAPKKMLAMTGKISRNLLSWKNFRACKLQVP